MISLDAASGSRKVVISPSTARVSSPPLRRGDVVGGGADIGYGKLDINNYRHLIAHNPVGQHRCGFPGCDRSFHRLGTFPRDPLWYSSNGSNWREPYKSQIANIQLFRSNETPPEDPRHCRFIRQPGLIALGCEKRTVATRNG